MTGLPRLSRDPGLLFGAGPGFRGDVGWLVLGRPLSTPSAGTWGSSASTLPPTSRDPGFRCVVIYALLWPPPLPSFIRCPLATVNINARCSRSLCWVPLRSLLARMPRGRGADGGREAGAAACGSSGNHQPLNDRRASKPVTLSDVVRVIGAVI